MFRRSRFLAGAEAAELRWFTPEGTEMDVGTWSDPSALAIALYLGTGPTTGTAPPTAPGSSTTTSSCW